MMSLRQHSPHRNDNHDDGLLSGQAAFFLVMPAVLHPPHQLMSFHRKAYRLERHSRFRQDGGSSAGSVGDPRP